MRILQKLPRLLLLIASLLVFGVASASDLADIKARGELRHLGIRYANFVTGAGDGFDVELTQGFAKHLGVKYTLVYTDFYSVVRDLLGKNVQITDGNVELVGDFPIKGDMIATGFTYLPWREKILLFSEPTFPSQVVLIARADSDMKPVPDTGSLTKDIVETKKLIGKQSVLAMEKTCLDPANYGLKNSGYDIRLYTRSTNINEMVPALLNKEADLSLLDVPDLMLDMPKWPGKFKVLGPISEDQILAAAFPKDSPNLRDAFNEYLRKIKADGTYDKLVDKYYPAIRQYFPDYFKKT